MNSQFEPKKIYDFVGPIDSWSNDFVITINGSSNGEIRCKGSESAKHVSEALNFYKAIQHGELIVSKPGDLAKTIDSILDKDGFVGVVVDSKPTNPLFEAGMSCARKEAQQTIDDLRVQIEQLEGAVRDAAELINFQVTKLEEIKEHVVKEMRDATCESHNWICRPEVIKSIKSRKMLDNLL